MPPIKAMDEQPSSDNSQLLMAGTRQIEIAELSVTAKKIDKPPMRATECACTFCTPLKSESSAGPCNRASLMTSKVNSAEATKLSKKENIYFISTKKSGLLEPDQAMSQKLLSRTATGLVISTPTRDCTGCSPASRRLSDENPAHIPPWFN